MQYLRMLARSKFKKCSRACALSTMRNSYCCSIAVQSVCTFLTSTGWCIDTPGLFDIVVTCKIHVAAVVTGCSSFSLHCGGQQTLTAKPIQGAAVALQGVDNVHSSHSLSASVLSVCDRITNDGLEKILSTPRVSS
jgi:hypothetical protein